MPIPQQVLLRMNQSLLQNGAQLPCLVLMYKAPERSKRRMVHELGDGASAIAELLFACAREDASAWAGPVCYAPADEQDREWLQRTSGAPEQVEIQGPGNLGQRISQVSFRLFNAGHQRHIFVGIDCPEISQAYIQQAAQALDNSDVVLGPAVDGGVVLMGSRHAWPSLVELPWSESSLCSALVHACARSGLSVATLDTLHDVDSVADFKPVGARIAKDQRPSRLALVQWINDHISPRLQNHYES
jgi:rSAM/selenodomain-associated transferase 1